MEFHVEYRAWFYIDVEADCLEEAIDKADKKRNEFCEQTPEIAYSELSWANWDDADGKFHEKDFNY